MKRVIIAAKTPLEYSESQTAVGAPLKTLKGSVIKRSSKFGVGKEIGGSIYFHKDYALDILDEATYNEAVRLLEASGHYLEDYNCMRYDFAKGDVAFQEGPDFDTAREPLVGEYVVVNPATGKCRSGYSNTIWHHRWLWVKNNYEGFDVAESWNWSKTWLSTLTEPADGTNQERWLAQLARFGLK